MGAGNSTSSPAYGVALNPRLEYTNKISKQKQEHVLLDTPSLVKLQSGTIRYRYVEDGKDIDQGRIEKPHESQGDLNKKGGYFYHARLKEEEDQNDSVKFCYVYKGAQRTRQKQVYYVFGKGLKTNESGFIEPKYKNDDPGDGEKFYKFHGHLYYDVQILEDDISEEEKIEEISILGDGKTDNETNQVELTVKGKEKCSITKRRLAIKMYKPQSHIHFYKENEELLDEDLISDSKSRSNKKRLKVLLTPR